ncbi:MAG TPA: hypothetical protein VEB66_10480 [Opitutaceae bacterium]|nr:hypothetical protein [Opitutaceae bacterium]
MTRIISFIVLALAGVGAVFARPVSEADEKAIKADIEHMMTLFEKGDADALLARTHESVYVLAGGDRAEFEKAIRAAVQQLMQMEVKFLGSELGRPTQLYAAGEHELCFIPRVATMSIEGQKVRSTGFMVAVRTKGVAGWKYLDGAGIAANPALLKTLFPDVDPKVALPPSKMEKL